MVDSRLQIVLIAAAMLHCGSALTAAEPPLDPAALARRIDEHLAARWSREGIVAAPPADDAEFLRRAYLDLTGRIPRAADVYEFLADERADKRSALIDQLVADPRFAVHQGNLWRAELIPETATDRQAALLQRGFENWLVGQSRANVPYDQFVRSLLTVPLPAAGEPAEPVLRDPERPNPLAFIAAKDARPENLAAAVTRSFLGVRLECAECHDHPFADWTQDQFWQQAAFFGGLQKQGAGRLVPLVEVRARREVVSPHDHATHRARWLSGEAPPSADARSPRALLADWIVAPENPYFARAGANRLWAQMFGVGLVEPIDDFHDNNPPSDAALLNELAQAFVASGFDSVFMLRALGRTEAYQRTSMRTDASQDATRLPARMTVKALTGEQFVDSLQLATGHRDADDKGAARRQLLSRFTRGGSASEPATSVQQALTLLNGRFVERATDPMHNPTLIAAVQTPGLAPRERIESLYMATLSRAPTDAEHARLSATIGNDDESPAAYADIFWILLNGAEFRLNH